MLSKYSSAKKALPPSAATVYALGVSPVMVYTPSAPVMVGTHCQMLPDCGQAYTSTPERPEFVLPVTVPEIEPGGKIVVNSRNWLHFVSQPLTAPTRQQ